MNLMCTYILADFTWILIYTLQVRGKKQCISFVADCAILMLRAFISTRANNSTINKCLNKTARGWFCFNNDCCLWDAGECHDIFHCKECAFVAFYKCLVCCQNNKIKDTVTDKVNILLGKCLFAFHFFQLNICF